MEMKCILSSLFSSAQKVLTKLGFFFSIPLSLVYQQIFLIRFLEGHLWSDLRHRVRLLALKISPVMTNA